MVAHEPNAHSRFDTRKLQERSESLAEGAQDRRCGSAKSPARHDPAAPVDPALRDIQLALAREFGFAGWTALRQALDDVAEARHSLAEKVDIVLSSAMWRADRTAASRLLARSPEIGAANLYAAASTGNRAAPRRRSRRRQAERGSA
jgi:hypothetical protein